MNKFKLILVIFLIAILGFVIYLYLNPTKIEEIKTITTNIINNVETNEPITNTTEETQIKTTETDQTEPIALNSTVEETKKDETIVMAENEPECINEYTEYRGDSFGNIEALERHNVECPPGKALNSLKLVSDNKGSLSYNYTCCRKDIETCETRVTTPGSQEFSGSTNPLTKLGVKCNEGEVLSGIKLFKDGIDYKYQYKCCKLKNPIGNCENNVLSFSNDQHSALNYVDQEMKCNNNKAINNFNPRTIVALPSCLGSDCPITTRYVYNYQCCE